MIIIVITNIIFIMIIIIIVITNIIFVRLVATLHPCMPDVSQQLAALLKQVLS